MHCPACYKNIPPGATTCDFCRTPLFDPSSHYQPTEPVSGVSVGDQSFAVGSLIDGRYLVMRELGRGGMGVVYLVKDQQLRGKEVALKLIRAELTANDQGKERFVQEVLAAQELTHSNVVKVFHLDEVAGQSFFTMEYVQGRSLRAMAEERKGENLNFTLQECGAILLPVLEALHHAHTQSQPVIHRDIKPDNIMVTGDFPTPLVTVLDFGLAKMLSPSQLTSSAMTMGSAYYMAPEQLYGIRDIDQRADLFSVGVVCYEMLTGQIPSGRFKLPAELNPDLPSTIDDLLDKALQQRASDRFASAREFAVALGSVVSGVFEPVELEKDQVVVQSSAVASSPVESQPVAPGSVPSSRPPVPSKGDTWRDPVTGMEFVWVPGGCFQMGSNNENDERPVHEVCVDGFWMGRYAVMQAEWQQVMGNNPSDFKGDRNPVEQVSWDDAQGFIRKLNVSSRARFRLPTEAEWEYAARSGGRNEKYAGGNDFDHIAWYYDNSGGITHPVGMKVPNGLGLYDMSGNVWEWCQDIYDSSAYTKHSRNNPVVSRGGSDRVVRGGCWCTEEWCICTTYRSYGTPDSTRYSKGIRLVRNEEEEDVARQDMDNVGVKQHEAEAAASRIAEEEVSRKAEEAWREFENSKAQEAEEAREWSEHEARIKAERETQRKAKEALQRAAEKDAAASLKAEEENARRKAEESRRNSVEEHKRKAEEALQNAAEEDTRCITKESDDQIESNVGMIWLDPVTGMEFVWVPGGSYQMGSDDGLPFEKPVHEVHLDGFWMGRYAVTQAEWQLVMGNNPSVFKGDRNPVESVSWYDVQEFIRKLNVSGSTRFRLPTEAEWEYAARSGGRNEEYAGGGDDDRVAWHDDNSGGETHPVGMKAPNGLGLYDMSGNVWEWCQDVFDPEAYSKHSRNNPVVSGGGSKRVRRGGSCDYFQWAVRAAFRGCGAPDDRGRYPGFRLVRNEADEAWRLAQEKLRRKKENAKRLTMNLVAAGVVAVVLTFFLLSWKKEVVSSLGTASTPATQTSPVSPKYSLTIRTKPSDAVVRFMNSSLTYRPGIAVTAASYDVEISRDGYESRRYAFQIKDRDFVSDVVALKRTNNAYSLTIQTNPLDATVVFVNASLTYSSGMKLQPGKYSVQVRRDGYSPRRHEIRIKDRDVVYEVILSPLYSLTIQPTPSDAKVKIVNIKPTYVNGIMLEPGEYKVEVSKEGYKTVVENVAVVESDMVKPVELEKLAEVVQTPAVASSPVESQSATPAPAAQTRPSKPSKGETWRDPQIGMEFVWVPGGCYQMGSNDGDSDERPVHEVCVDGFWMGRYEVTQAEWQRVMGTKVFYIKGDRNPAEGVCWSDAQEFISKFNVSGSGRFRLPTEAEWEYAARSGGRNEKYAGGNEFERVAWCAGLFTHHPVGTKAPNGLGLYDMSGNVYEWCQDVYDRDAYSKHARNNPVVSDGGSKRVARGGSFNVFFERKARAASRRGFHPGDKASGLGFRLLGTD